MDKRLTKDEQLNSLTINYIKKEVIDKLDEINYNFKDEVNSEENRYMLRVSTVHYLNDVYPRFSDYIDVEVEGYKHNRSIINIKFIDKETLKEDYLENLIAKYYGCATLTINI